jgi:hypothetical protein
MEQADLKLKCLEMTKELSNSTDQWIEAAKKLYSFLTTQDR